MFGGDGDGELSIILELKQFTKVDMELDTIKDAELVARSFQRNCIHDRRITYPVPPRLETTITKNNDGKFVVWYRDMARI